MRAFRWRDGCSSSPTLHTHIPHTLFTLLSSSLPSLPPFSLTPQPSPTNIEGSNSPIIRAFKSIDAAHSSARKSVSNARANKNIAAKAAASAAAAAHDRAAAAAEAGVARTIDNNSSVFDSDDDLLDTDSSDLDDFDDDDDGNSGRGRSPVSPIERIRAKLVRTSERLDAARRVAAEARASPEGGQRIIEAAAKSAARRLAVERKHERDFVDVADRVAEISSHRDQHSPTSLPPVSPLLSKEELDADERAFEKEVAAAEAARKAATTAAWQRVRVERKKQDAAQHAKRRAVQEDRDALDERVRQKQTRREEGLRNAKKARQAKLQKLTRAREAVRAEALAAKAVEAAAAAEAAKAGQAAGRAKARATATPKVKRRNRKLRRPSVDRSSSSSSSAKPKPKPKTTMPKAKNRSSKLPKRKEQRAASRNTVPSRSQSAAPTAAPTAPPPPPVVTANPPTQPAAARPLSPRSPPGMPGMPIKLAPRAVVRSPLRLLQPEVDVASLSYYELLGVKRRVTPKRLRKAYRKLARVYHPDKNPACAPDGIAPGLFTEITRAYQTLSEPSSRQMYDHTRMQAKQQRAGVRRRGSASRTRTPGPSARTRKASASSTKKRASVHRAKSDWA